MSVNSVETPFPIFTDVDGNPLEDGYIYIGTPNLNPEVSPKQTYWDIGISIVAAQPIRTIGGYPSKDGTVARIYVEGDYSITVRNKNGTLVYSSANATGILSSINSFASIGQLIGYSTAPENTSVNVSGYYVANDGGGSIFNWDSTVDKATANSGTIIDPSVSLALQGTGVGLGCWIRQYESPLNVKWFGAKGDGIANDQPAIQAALDHCLRYKTEKIVHIPDGDYKIDLPLNMGWGHDYSSIEIHGAGATYKGATAGTTIYPSFSNAPAIVVQGTRASVIKDLTIYGLNYNYVVTNNLGSTACLIDDTSATTWTDPSLYVNADSQYAPYAGIAVDPYSGVQPTPHYPDVIFPTWTGISAQYGKNFSSNLKLENVYILGFNTGLVVQPCNASGNGDFISLFRVWMSQCAYGYSLGGYEARLSNMIDSYITDTHTAITGTKHGVKTGKFNAEIIGTGFDRVIQIADIQSDYGVPQFNTCYGEQIYMIGSFGSTSTSNGKIKFSNCEFNFASQLSAQRGVPEYVAKGLDTILLFDGGFFKMTNENAFFNFEPYTEFRGVKINYPVTVASSAQALMRSFLSHGVFGKNSYKDRNRQIFARTYEMASPYTLKTEYLYAPYGTKSNVTALPIRPIVYDMDFTDGKFYNPEKLVVTTGWTGISVVGRDITITDIGTSFSSRSFYNIDIGDIVQYNTTVYYVTGLTGTTLTLRALNNFTSAGVLNDPIPASPTLNSYFYHTRTQLLQSEHIFNFTSGSAIANVVKASDNSFGSLSSYFSVGDRLIIENELGGVWALSDDIKITNVNDATGEITFGHTSRKTVSGVLVSFISKTFNS